MAAKGSPIDFTFLGYLPSRPLYLLLEFTAIPFPRVESGDRKNRKNPALVTI